MNIMSKAMSNISFVLVPLIFCSQGFSQNNATSSTVSAPQPSAGTASTASTISPGATTATLDSLKPKSQSPWRVKIGTEAVSAESDARKNGLGAKIEMKHLVSVGYNVNSATSITVAQEFLYNHLGASNDTNKISPTENRVIMMSPYIMGRTKTPGLLGSKDLSPSVRYYVPLNYDRRTTEAGGYGMIRGDLLPTWEVGSTKGTLSYLLSPRITLAPQDNVWTRLDGKSAYLQPTARLVHGVLGSYSTTENLTLESFAVLDQHFDYNNSFNFNKDRNMSGPDKNSFKNLDAISKNNMHIGLGFTWTKKIADVSLSINPYVEKIANLSETYRIINKGNKSDPQGAITFGEFFNYQNNMNYNLELSVSL